MLKSGVATTKSKGIKTYIEGLKKGELNFTLFLRSTETIC